MSAPRLRAVPPKGARATMQDRFNAKWIPEPNSGCWLWLGAHVPTGYGMIGNGARGTGFSYAHRVSYELYCGAIPDGIRVLHRCDMPPCVNPDHLFLGTQADNMADKKAKGRHRPGEQHPNSFLKADAVAEMRIEYAAGKTSLSILGRKHGICFQYVHDIINRKVWRNV